MRVQAISALSLVGLAATAAANQLDTRQQATDDDSLACLSSIMALAEASPTVPAALEAATGDCVPTTLTAAASSFTSDAAAWYTTILDAISGCPAWPSGSTLPALPTLEACTGEQPSSAATATTTSASGNAVATSTSSLSTAASGTASATTSARSSAASGSAGRSATTSSSQSANAAARETGVLFAAVAMAAFGAAAL